MQLGQLSSPNRQIRPALFFVDLDLGQTIFYLSASGSQDWLGNRRHVNGLAVTNISTISVRKVMSRGEPPPPPPP
jgi:hypothetical protein